MIAYRWSGEPMKLEDRFVNPLGFQVTSYRRDPEALAVSGSPSAQVIPNDAPQPLQPSVQPVISGGTAQ
jgi:type IV secretion system protein VirB8